MELTKKSTLIIRTSFLAFTLLCAYFSATSQQLHLPGLQTRWMSYFDGLRQRYVYQDYAVDAQENIFVAGMTDSLNSGHLITPGAFRLLPVTNRQQSNVNLVKLDSSGNIVWGTYVGAGTVRAVATDKLGNVVIAGSVDYGLSAQPMTTTPNAHKLQFQPFFVSPSVDLNISDGFIAKFSASGALLWCTYYGGNAADDIEGVATDTAGNVYVAGTTNSLEGIATGESYNCGQSTLLCSWGR